MWCRSRQSGGKPPPCPRGDWGASDMVRHLDRSTPSAACCHAECSSTSGCTTSEHLLVQSQLLAMHAALNECLHYIGAHGRSFAPCAQNVTPAWCYAAVLSAVSCALPHAMRRHSSNDTCTSHPISAVLTAAAA